MRSSAIAALRLVLSLVLCFAAGCTSKSNNNPQAPADNVAQSALARDTNPQVSDADLAAAARGNTDFALKAFPLLGAVNENAVFSPYSITQAIALAAAGAKGTTLGGIEQAMTFSLSQDRLNPAFNKLDLLLAAETTGAVLSNGGRLPQLSIVNAVWGQQDFPILPAYLDTLAINYGAGFHLVDFINKTEDARTTINSWVEQRTNSRIQNLIPQGALSTDTRVVLTNAIWFKANWASPFPAAGTATRQFINRDGSQSPAPFMRQTLSASYGQGNGFQAIDIPYVDEKLSMLVIMPAPGTFDAFLSALTPTKLNECIAQTALKQVDLALPKFTFSTGADLGNLLRSLGMTDAFAPGHADFSGIDGRFDLFISSVLHKAFISIDEQGTEAAAATAVIIGITSAPVSQVTLTVDHPFLFLVRDRQTGLVLFLGKIVSL